MRKYLLAYGAWLAGVLTAAGVAYYFYRRIIAMGDDALAKEFRLASGSSRAAEAARAPSAPSPQSEPEPGFEDAETIDDARPPTFDDLRRRRSGRAR